MFLFGLRKKLNDLEEFNNVMLRDNMDLCHELRSSCEAIDELKAENEKLKSVVAAQGALVGAFAEYIVMKHNPKAKKLKIKKGKKHGKKK